MKRIILTEAEDTWPILPGDLLRDENGDLLLATDIRPKDKNKLYLHVSHYGLAEKGDFIHGENNIISQAVAYIQSEQKWICKGNIHVPSMWQMGYKIVASNDPKLNNAGVHKIDSDFIDLFVARNGNISAVYCMQNYNDPKTKTIVPIEYKKVSTI